MKFEVWLFVAALGIVALGIAFPPSAQAVAYCALRDPVTTIYDLFPEANSYRSNVKTVGRGAREAVLTQLPFSLHFNELGRHTLYIAQRDGQPVGFVHARSELGEWGMTEFAWALSTDLKVLGVKVQRSRDPRMRQKVDNELAARVVGKDLVALRKQFENLPSAQADTQLATLLASAMKTLVITKAVWEDELPGLDIVGIAKQARIDADELVAIDVLYDPNVQKALNLIELQDSPVFDRTALVGYRLKKANGKAVAIAVRSPFELDNPHRRLLWVISADGEIKLVHNQLTGHADDDFASVVGYAPGHARDCSSLADLAALEMATLARHHLAN